MRNKKQKPSSKKAEEKRPGIQGLEKRLCKLGENSDQWRGLKPLGGVLVANTAEKGWFMERRGSRT